MPIPILPTYGRIVVLRRTGEDSASFDLVDGNYLFGREPHCDVRIQLASISPEHCRIFRNETGQAILENISIHGTILNGMTLEKGQSRELHHGDIMTVIERSFRFECVSHESLNSTPKRVTPHLPYQVQDQSISTVKQATPARLKCVAEEVVEECSSPVKSTNGGIQGSPIRTLRLTGSPGRISTKLMSSPKALSSPSSKVMTSGTPKSQDFPTTPIKVELIEHSKGKSPQDTIASPKRSFTITPVKSGKSPASPRTATKTITGSTPTPLTTDLFLSTPMKQLEKLPHPGVATSPFVVSNTLATATEFITESTTMEANMETSIESNMVSGDTTTLTIITSPAKNNSLETNTTTLVTSTPPPRANNVGSPNYAALFPPTPALAAASRLALASESSTPKGLPTTIKQSPVPTLATPSTPLRSPRYSVQTSTGGSPVVMDKEISGSPKLGKVCFYEMPPAQANTTQVFIEEVEEGEEKEKEEEKEEREEKDWVEKKEQIEKNNSSNINSITAEKEEWYGEKSPLQETISTEKEPVLDEIPFMMMDNEPNTIAKGIKVTTKSHHLMNITGTSEPMDDVYSTPCGQETNSSVEINEKDLTIPIDDQSMAIEPISLTAETLLEGGVEKGEEDLTLKVPVEEKPVIKAEFKVEESTVIPIKTASFEDDQASASIINQMEINTVPIRQEESMVVMMMANDELSETLPLESKKVDRETTVPTEVISNQLFSTVALTQSSTTETVGESGGQGSQSVPITPRRSTRLNTKTPMSTSAISAVTLHSTTKRVKTPIVPKTIDVEGTADSSNQEDGSTMMRKMATRQSTRTPKDRKTPVSTRKGSSKKTPIAKVMIEEESGTVVTEEALDATSPTMNSRAARGKGRKAKETTTIEETENIALENRDQSDLYNGTVHEKKTPGRKRMVTDMVPESTDEQSDEGRRRSTRVRTPAKVN